MTLVDKFEKMLGSYGPRDEPYTVDFESDDAPSGLIARTGIYNVVSRVIDDDGGIHASKCGSFPQI
jgi:Rho GDP-dissociation inhibitor